MASSREKRLIEDLQADLRLLSNETKRRYPPVKEAAESAIMKIRTSLPPTGKNISGEKIITSLRGSCNDIMQPFIMGCDTRSLPIVQLCLTAIQRIVTHEIADGMLSKTIVEILLQIYEQGIDELQLRLLQTVIVLATSKSCALRGQPLAKAIGLCFRLHFTKNEVTNNTAEATVRQVVSLVFERVLEEDISKGTEECIAEDYLPASGSSKFAAPDCLTPNVEDAYYLFQDICQLVNRDSPRWLVGITEMTSTFGLELLESVLIDNEDIFKKHPEFKFLLKDRVCALVIRLFSPNIKHRQGAPPPPSGSSHLMNKDKPFFPISMRLLRVVSILLKKYHSLLVTESEIFLSLLIKFLDTDKPSWQRALAIEVISQLCAQPKLLKSFCVSYDMQPHSTKIFHNLVSSLGSFIQNIFIQAQTTPSNLQLGQQEAQNGSSNGMTTQLNFEYHGIILPLVSLPTGTSNSVKYMYLEMLEKAQPPSVPEGYVLTMAYTSMLDLIKGLTALIDNDLAEDTRNVPQTTSSVAVPEEMVNSSWCIMLSVLSLLLDASTDESCTESVLKCIESCAGICGHLKLNSARDAFIIVLCKASLPLHYVIPVLVSSMPRLPSKIFIAQSNEQNVSEQQHVVAVGQSLPNSGGSLAPGCSSVSLTAKNVQCMRTILNLAHCHGAHMNTAWQLLLTTLQHLVWILGLKPTTNGQLKPSSRQSGDGNTTPTNTVLTTAVLGDLPVLSNMLTRLFEASQNLDDVALHHLINALCSLSIEAMDTAYNNAVKEPSLFAVAKLMETGLVNMDRIEILWRPVTGHLLEVCQHPNVVLREWGAEGVTALVKAALKHYHGEKLRNNPRLLHMFLLPLKEVCTVAHFDVRQKQLDGILQILNSCGDSLSAGWSDILDIISSATDNTTESLVRLGFRSVQLVISDYMVALPVTSLPQCIEVVARYAAQVPDFNISLTAIGLLWSMSDYMNQNKDRINASLSSLGESDDAKTPSTGDVLWMDLFSKMGQLCVDPRPAIRKSAGQTLFSTISAHWSTLSEQTWKELIWQVLFPLMDEVQKQCIIAPRDRNKPAETNILMHHSRDTEEKQWQETSVLTLAGIARVFKTKRDVLVAMDDFESAWSRVLDYIYNAAISSNPEVSRSALCSFEEILNPSENCEIAGNSTASRKAWEIWCNIGKKVTIPPPPGQLAPDEMLSQAYLTSYTQLFPTLHKNLQENFTTSDFKQLSQILHGSVCIPVRSDSTAFVMPTSTEILTPLQMAVVNAVDLVQKNVSPQSEITMYPAVFDFLLSIVEFASNPPTYGDIKNHTGPPDKAKYVCINYIAFAEYCMRVVVDLYQITACHKGVIRHAILTLIVKTLRVPIKRKHSSKSSSTWQLAVNAFMKVLQAGMPVARQHSQASMFDSLWDEVSGCMEDFLFPVTPLPTTLSAEDHKKHEAFDILLIELIRNEILPYSSAFPKNFLSRIVAMLNKGSIPLSTRDIDINVGTDRDRDELSKQCFSTLFQFSMLPAANGNPSSSEEEKMAEINEVTVTSLVQRCRSALTQYISSDRLKTHYPMSEAQLSEVMFALKAVDALLHSLKKSHKQIDKTLWNHVLDIYPVLVECIPTSSAEVRKSVAQVMGRFQTFLSLDNV
uniref:Protein MON2 homolog n=1 Tax=Phallusia mammillata TaxID=59560 RepID=A0A6F9DKD5_9ASCI|nr:protein MON2 homolog [Phallusia mammillata]